MARSLIISSSYQQVTAAYALNGSVAQMRTIDKRDASSLLVCTIDALLSDVGQTLETVDYLTVNRGPSPFTTLRVSITTANGIAFACDIPMVGVDGLKTLLSQYENDHTPVLVLLNAFGGDAYFARRITPESNVDVGCGPIEHVLQETLSHLSEPITLIGNGIETFKAILCNPRWSEQIHIDPLGPDYVSIETIAHRGYQQFMSQNTTTATFPLYLKEPRVHMRSTTS